MLRIGDADLAAARRIPTCCRCGRWQLRRPGVVAGRSRPLRSWPAGAREDARPAAKPACWAPRAAGLLQANAPVTDFMAGARDPAVNESPTIPDSWASCAASVSATRRVPTRIEMVDGVDHCGGAAGSLRKLCSRAAGDQLDRYRDALFYEAPSALKDRTAAQDVL